MARRFDRPNVLPSPTDGGLTAAVSGFLQVRQMQEDARQQREMHQAQMSMFNQQLITAGLEEQAARLNILSSIASPGVTLGELAPGAAAEIGQAVGIDPEQLGQAVLRPFGPGDAISRGVEVFLENASLGDLARLGEVAAGDGQTLEEIRGAAARGEYSRLVHTIQVDWIKNNPDQFHQAIAEELGPTTMYDIRIGGHTISLTGDSAANALLQLMKLTEAQQAGNAAAAKEARDEVIQWIREIGDQVGVTAPPALVSSLVDAMTDPAMSVEQRLAQIDRLRERSPEMQLLVDAAMEGRAIGTSVLENIYRDDPQVGPMLDFLSFVQERLEVFPAAERTRILSALEEPIRRATGVSFSLGAILGRPRIRIDQPEGGIGALSETIGMSEREIEAIINLTADELGISREEAISVLGGGDIPEGAGGDPGGVEAAPPPAEPEAPPELLIDGEMVPRRQQSFIRGALRQIETLEGRLATMKARERPANISPTQHDAAIRRVESEIQRHRTAIERMRADARREMGGS
jgi:hypothetical protein